jgi:hypothetical protein
MVCFTAILEHNGDKVALKNLSLTLKFYQFCVLKCVKSFANLLLQTKQSKHSLHHDRCGYHQSGGGHSLPLLNSTVKTENTVR